MVAVESSLGMRNININNINLNNLGSFLVWFTIKRNATFNTI